LSLVNVVCCWVQVSPSGWSLVQPTECDVEGFFYYLYLALSSHTLQVYLRLVSN